MKPNDFIRAKTGVDSFCIPNGFTLIEILITLTIVSVAVLSLGSFTISMVGSSQVSRERLAAVHMAEQILEFWQNDASDFAPTVSGSDCSLSTSAAIPGYPVNVVCTPTSGVSIPYTVNISQTQTNGPLPSDLTVFQNFTSQPAKGVNLTPFTKVVKVSWTHHGTTHSIYLTHLSMVK